MQLILHKYDWFDDGKNYSCELVFFIDETMKACGLEAKWKVIGPTMIATESKREAGIRIL